MNNPSYLRDEIQYVHITYVINMPHGYRSIERCMMGNDRTMLAKVNVNEARNETARSIVRQLAGAHA